MLQGFILGIASGTACLAYCAPVLVPVLLGEGKNIQRNYVILGQYLGGRLCGYLLFALLAWAVRFPLSGLQDRELVFGVVYVVLALFLVYYGLFNHRALCAGQIIEQRPIKRFSNRLPPMPLVFGFLSGVTLCPPFLLAFTEAADKVAVWQSLLVFFTFFLGTSLYFLPIPLVGAFNRFDALQKVGKLAAVVVAVYYLYAGLIKIAGGVIVS
ncbi:MAG: hypothetical protein A4E55_02154 [Pelotomaculum sp. PtaU1.Bin035]|nr:MAG: hypothetical protein A4E55_02154 [Pelotomaculum sp. PtaU1.Bin035]